MTITTVEFFARQEYLIQEAWDSIRSWRAEHNVDIDSYSNITFVTATLPYNKRKLSAKLPPEPECSAKFDRLRQMLRPKGT